MSQSDVPPPLPSENVYNLMNPPLPPCCGTSFMYDLLITESFSLDTSGKTASLTTSIFLVLNHCRLTAIPECRRYCTFVPHFFTDDSAAEFQVD